ncbi:MAG: TIGR03032 family protein [Nevskiales bacterium]|nr:TIGR03032 family protein [Nevskiales bacterium]
MKTTTRSRDKAGKSGAQKPPPEKLKVAESRNWLVWQAEQKISLAFTTYQTGKLFLIGQRPDGHLSIFERTLEHCMGLCAHGDSLYLNTLYQLWRFNNVVPNGKTANGYDKVYVPMASWVTGDVDVHDIAIDAKGRPIFVNTLFSCLATVSPEVSFVPLWKPPFITRLAPEDRCHLNGVAMKDGLPRYVTAVSQSDVREGWRERRGDGGIVMEVPSGKVVCEGLSMPHSPRWYKNRLWLLNSGHGTLGYVDFKTRRFQAVAFCPGYARGLTFAGDYAIVGLSKPRKSRTFRGLVLDEQLKQKKMTARCGLEVIHLETGATAHSLGLEGIVEELYDVVVLRGVQKPGAIGFKTDEIRRTLLVGDLKSLDVSGQVSH